jgi:hypothetical protein
MNQNVVDHGTIFTNYGLSRLLMVRRRAEFIPETTLGSLSVDLGSIKIPDDQYPGVHDATKQKKIISQEENFYTHHTDQST